MDDWRREQEIVLAFDALLKKNAEDELDGKVNDW